MAEKTINARIRCKIDTAENWNTNNPVLLVGELGIESDTKLIKVGDGTTSWTSLPYLQYLPLSGGQLTGGLKIARGFQNGLLDTDDGDILYIDNNGNLCIGYGLSGKTKLTSNRIDVESNAFYVKHNFYVENGSANFQYNGKSVAVKDDIPKTLNNKTLVANGNTTIYGTDITLSSDNSGNLTDAINGKADTSAIPTKTSQLTNDSDFATTSQIPDTSGFVPNTRTINSKALSSNISLNNKDVGALPDYTINISHQTAGNPRIVKFISVNYASAATCFKMGAMTCHYNGVSYQFLTDMLIAVTTGGVVTANIYKFAQSSIGSVDGVARYTGDVFYVNDTTNKIVDFYILCGQYSSSQFTPITKVGSTTIAYVTQYSGTATYYSSGTKTWANGCGTTYARLSDIPTKTSQLTNDSGFATTSQIPDISGKANLSGGNEFYGLQGFDDGINFAAPSGLVGGKIYSDGDLNVDFHNHLHLKNYTYGDNSQWYIHIDYNGNLIFGKE